MFSYSGWNAAAYVAEEIRDPGRNVPLRARRSARSRSSLIYLRAERAVPLRDADRASWRRCADGRLIDTVAERLFGFAAGNLLAVFTIVSIAASISAMVLAGPRVYYAMARDGMFLPRAATRAPAVPHAGLGDRRAGGLERRPRAVRARCRSS